VWILGVSALYHDSAAVLLHNGHIVAAAQEERFSRRKHDARFPRQALQWCLAHAEISASEVQHVVFYEKPLLKFERLLETYLAFAPHGYRSFSMAMPVWLREKLFLKGLLVEELRRMAPAVSWEGRVRFSEHHLSHAASAFYPSPFEEAAVLTMDGVGEWASSSLALGRGQTLEIQRELHFPHSLGLLYSAFTYHAGFKVNSGEYKLMGLAPYGTPRFAPLIRERLMDIKSDGTFRLDLKYFDYCAGLTMTNGHFDQLFGAVRRSPQEPITEFHMDMAASIQRVTEDVVLALARSIAQQTGQRRLCLAGGVALNCVANGRLLREGPFEEIWIQPAAGDAGGALGAAQALFHLGLGQPRIARNVDGGDAMQAALLGPAYAQGEIEQRLWAAGAHFEVLDDETLLKRCAAEMADGQALAWSQGRAEFGPRALGNRSILADPRSPRMQSQLNLKVKFRESFRPFAPAVLEEDAADWFDLSAQSPYMLLVAQVAQAQRVEGAGDGTPAGFERLGVVRSSVPAVTHVDGSARVQTVNAREHGRFHALISAFKAQTGCPVVINTSFNVRGEPPVLTPEDAFRCFMGSDIDVMAVGNCYLKKSQQASQLLRRTTADFDED
jgi:carbamoyltransferase